ncbi:MAG: SiaB family protein kinase [Bacteroidia bacterium]|nr:SiaB family protein kinase [Bacteroidia bacterium]MDW8014976.1 SiaB family protein kinase [Bacteroidia bacterium]
MNVSYDSRLLFRHEGPLDMEVLPLLVHNLEGILQREGARPPLRRKVVTCLIELAQNIIHYAVHKENYPPLLMVSRRNDKGFILLTRNLVHYSQELFLQNYLHNLTQMPRAELENLHYSTLTEGSYSDSGGAGLGLIQVLFKADQFEYEFVPADGEYSWFSVKATFLS